MTGGFLARWRRFGGDEDGSALVIHEGGDDGVTQPIGGAGARVGCAAISG